MLLTSKSDQKCLRILLLLPRFRINIWDSDIRVSDKPNLNKGLNLGLSQFFATAQAASKNTNPFKNGQEWPENSHLSAFTKVQSKSLIHIVVFATYYDDTLRLF